MEPQIINISACAAGILVLVLIAYCFYKVGWKARNLQQNKYLCEQINCYKELYEKEKEAGKQSVIRHYKIINGLQGQISIRDRVLRDFIDKIDPSIVEEHFQHLRKDSPFYSPKD